ncbi:MAG: aryl-sulfate sulfotransferase [Deltaproteobacteria bacterium]|nr:aryl-sulfate sulfotransferase [Deltaproteobacteria bacterium]
MLLWLAACSPSDGPPSEEPAGWSAEPLDLLVLGQRLVRSGPVAASEVVCTAETDPTERHVVDGSAETVELYGLLADTAYRCEIAAGDAVDVVTFRTEPLPEWLPSWHLEEADGDGAYTIFNHGTDERNAREAKILVVDPEGRLRWYYDVPYDAADLDVSFLGDGEVLYGGGYAAPPTVIDLAGTVLLRAVDVDVYHHHAEQLDDGTFVALTIDPNTDGSAEWTGMEIEILDPAMTETVWSWRTQRGIDEGWLEAPLAGDDPYHMNSVAVLADAVYPSFRNAEAVVKLDRSTGDRVWTLGPEGDFTLLDALGAPADAAEWFYGAHAPEHDGDRILFHDNGFRRPGERTTRIVEMVIDEAALTARVAWEYTEPGWYEPIWGDVDRLENGHVLYTRAHCGTCLPDDPSTTEIAELDPETLSVVWRLVMDDVHDAGYRAERIDGCAIFANARYCAAL